MNLPKYTTRTNVTNYTNINNDSFSFMNNRDKDVLIQGWLTLDITRADVWKVNETVRPRFNIVRFSEGLLRHSRKLLDEVTDSLVFAGAQKRFAS